MSSGDDVVLLAMKSQDTLERTHGVPTPANALLQGLMADAVLSATACTGTMHADDILRRMSV